MLQIFTVIVWGSDEPSLCSCAPGLTFFDNPPGLKPPDAGGGSGTGGGERGPRVLARDPDPVAPASPPAGLHSSKRSDTTTTSFFSLSSLYTWSGESVYVGHHAHTGATHQKVSIDP